MHGHSGGRGQQEEGVRLLAAQLRELPVLKACALRGIVYLRLVLY